MASPFYFDADLARAAVEFFPRFLRLVDAEWAGRPFVLAPWQVHHTGQIFGWRRKSDGLRRYRRVRGFVARKNGKTEWGAGIGHLLTIGDGEPGAQVYSHAIDKAQASILFDKACRMVMLSEPLAKLYEVTQTSLFCPALMATFRPLSGDALGKHGLSPHAILGDEAHEWRNDRLHTFLKQGMASRRQPLDLIITTAGQIKTYGHELYLDAKAIAEDPNLDPECYVFIHEADQEDDWTDPAIWAKANPNLGVSVKREFLEDLCRSAKQNARMENDFRRYHLNQWVEQHTRWLPMREWPRNTAEPENANLWKQLPERMRGRKGFAALDLGSTRDITAKLWLFPPENENERFVLVPQFWIPEDTVHDRDTPRTPFTRWIADGAVQTTPGNVTDYGFVEAETMRDIEERGFRFLRSADDEGKPCGLGYDAWNATQLMIALQEHGLPVRAMRQGPHTLGASTKELERLFMSGRLEHGNHPVMRWMFANAIVDTDKNGNITPAKGRAVDKIDIVVCAVMALALLMGVKQEVEKKYQMIIV